MLDEATRRAASAYADAERPRRARPRARRPPDRAGPRAGPHDRPGDLPHHPPRHRTHRRPRHVGPPVGARPGRARRSTTALDPVAHVKAVTELKRYAPTSTDLAVAPGLAARRRGPRQAGRPTSGRCTATRPARSSSGRSSSRRSSRPGVVRSPGWGSAALAAYSAQPALAFAGTADPPDRRRPGQAAHPTAARRPPVGHHARRQVAARRPRRRRTPRPSPAPSTTPCWPTASTASSRTGSRRAPAARAPRSREHVRVTDLIQYKPGEFVLDKCADCRHVFQNPRLSIEGLDFYYRDFYDGLGEDELEFVFAQGDDSYAGRVDMVAPPRRAQTLARRRRRPRPLLPRRRASRCPTPASTGST